MILVLLVSFIKSFSFLRLSCFRVGITLSNSVHALLAFSL